MADAIDDDLKRRTEALLDPGEVQLNGAIVHTDYAGQEDVQMMQATLDVGDVIAEHAGHEPTDVYVYSGNDDPDFGVNQHQGKTLDDDAFVWECQQLVRDGTYDVVFYYEAAADQSGIVAAVEALDYDLEVVSVEG